MSNKFALSWWVSLFGAGAFVVAGIFFAYSGLGVPNHPGVNGLMGSVDLAVRPSTISATSRSNVPSSNLESNKKSTVTSPTQFSSESSPAVVEVQSSAPVINYYQRSDDLTRVATEDPKVTSTTVATSDGIALPSGSSSITNVLSKDKVSSKSTRSHSIDLGGEKKNESRISVRKSPRRILDNATTTTTSSTTTTTKIVKSKGSDSSESRDD